MLFFFDPVSMVSHTIDKNNANANPSARSHQIRPACNLQQTSHQCQQNGNEYIPEPITIQVERRA